MRPSTARQRNIEMEGEGEENMSDEEVAKQLALSERKSGNLSDTNSNRLESNSEGNSFE